MNTQTLPRIGDRVRVVSVEVDAMRAYVGRVGTVTKPERIPNGCQDRVSVRFQKSKRFKAVSAFFKPECLEVEPSPEPDPRDLTTAKVQEVEVRLEEIHTRIEEAESSLSRAWKVGDRVRTAALNYPPIPSQEVTVVGVPTTDDQEDPGYDYTVRFKNGTQFWYRPECLFPLELGQCSPTSDCSKGLAGLVSQPDGLVFAPPMQSSLENSSAPSCEGTSQTLNCMTISEPSIQVAELGTLSPVASLAKTCPVPTQEEGARRRSLRALARNAPNRQTRQTAICHH